MTTLESLRAALAVAAAAVPPKRGGCVLTVRELMVLLDLPPRGSLRYGALYAFGALPNSPALTKALHRLVLDGLVDRAEDRDDRRTCRLSLTDAGRALVARLEAAMVGETVRRAA